MQRMVYTCWSEFFKYSLMHDDRMKIVDIGSLCMLCVNEAGMY